MDIILCTKMPKHTHKYVVEDMKGNFSEVTEEGRGVKRCTQKIFHLDLSNFKNIL